jgi:glycerophosphoryl diester phosphodiesterase
MKSIRRSIPHFIAHRGESYDAPENTLAAFRLAWERGATAIELDLHLSADGQLVVCHDADLTRTGGVDWRIAEKTLAELRTVDVGRWKDARFAGERLPTLDEVLAMKPAGTSVWAEIKCGPAAIEPLAAAVASISADELRVISFNRDVIREVKQGLPSHRVDWLVKPAFDEATGRWSPDVPAMIDTARALGADGVGAGCGAWLTPAAVAAFASQGLTLATWTVDDPARCRELFKAGVMAVTTNRAAWMRAQLHDLFTPPADRASGY